VARRKADRTAPRSALRTKALRRLRQGARARGRQPEDSARLLNELQVHQVELEVQNEELRRTQAAAEQAQAKYLSLFNFAPVGYFMLDRRGAIKETNHAGAALLDAPRRFLIGRLFSSFLAPASRRPFRDFLALLCRSEQPRSCEVALLARDRTARMLQLSGLAYGGPEHEAGIRLSAADISLLKASQATLQRTHRELRNLTIRLQEAREEECTRIAREVHDELGQTLTLLKLDLASLQQEPGDRAHLQERLAGAATTVDGLIETVQNIAIRLRPMVLDRFGLLAAINWWSQEFQSRTKIACRLELPLEGVPRLERAREVAAFRIFQEVLTNVARHARATEITVTLATPAGWFICEVRDNGRGITPRALASATSFGLDSMRQRAALLNGEVTIQGLSGKGTTVRIALPLTDPGD